MTRFQQLVSFHIVEHDKNDHSLITWTFPKITEQQRNYVLQKCLAKTKSIPFLYLKLDDEWIYISNTEISDSAKLPKLKYFSMVLFSKDFNVRKYEILGRVLSKCYCKNGNPVEVVKLYLGVFTTGSCSTQDNGTFKIRDFDMVQNASNVKQLISLFGLDIILVYTALLLKKRIAVYHHSLEELLKWLPGICALMPHRKPQDVLHPWIDLVDDLNLLKSIRLNFVAGFTDSAICSKNDLYDVLVNMPATEISVSPHAKENLTMTKMHKGIAIFMVQLSENADATDSQISKAINDKTQDLITQLRNLQTAEDAGPSLLETLKAKNLSPAVRNFFTNLALTENII